MLQTSLRAVTVGTTLLLFTVPSFADDKPKDRGEKTAREVVAQFEKGDPEWKVRVDGLSRLVKAGPHAIPVLVEALQDGSPPQRVFAAQVLAILAEPATGPVLEKALLDPSPQVRVYAIQGLSRLRRLDPAEQPYRELLGQLAPEASEQDGGRSSAGNIESALPALTLALEDPDAQVRSAAAAAVKKIEALKKRRIEKR